MFRPREAPVQAFSNDHVKGHQMPDGPPDPAPDPAEVASFIVQLAMPKFEINSPSEDLSRDPNKLPAGTVIA